MSKVDDHGLYDARPSILRASLYPLRIDRTREADITRWIAMCEKAGLIALYEVQGKPYLQVLDTKWTARSEPKYPQRTPENTRAQTQTSVALFVGVDEGVVVGEGARKRAVPEVPKPPADWIPSETWAAFVAHRKAKRAPLTDEAVRLIVGDLVDFRDAGVPPADVLNYAIKNGHTGLFFKRDKAAPHSKERAIEVTQEAEQILFGTRQ